MGSPGVGRETGTFDAKEVEEEDRSPQMYLSIEAVKNIEKMAQAPRSYSIGSMASRCQSVIVSKSDFENMPMISKCLPEYKPVALEKSAILSEGQVKVLSYHLPAIVRLFNWQLVFTTTRDGYSPLNFFEKCGHHEYTVIVIKDTLGFVFGAFCAEEWSNGTGFKGNGDAFVFTFRDGDDLEIFPATGADDQYQSSDNDGIIIGGSTISKGRAAITISNRFK